MEKGESELIREAKRDPEKFKPLYEKYFKKVFRFVYNRIGDKQDAADITSDVFLRALLKISTFTYKGIPLQAWLFRIAINECNHYFRKSKKEQLVVLDDDTLKNLYQEIEFDLEEIRWDALKRAIQKLKIKEVELIRLRFFESLSYREIGEILGITENNAKVKTYRILNTLKLKMAVK